MDKETFENAQNINPNDLDQEIFQQSNNVVNLTYQNCKFDPISVNSNEDVKHLNVYFKHKITERELKDQSGNSRKSTGSRYYASSEVVRYFF